MKGPFLTVQDASRYMSGGIKLWASLNKTSQTPTLQYTVAGDIILMDYRGQAVASASKEATSCIRLKQATPTGKSLLIESHDRFVTIGRAPENTIRIPDPEVSWEHGQIILMQGTYYYRHLSNSNPSILCRRGEERLLRPRKKEEVALRNQDRLTIGDTTLVIEFDLAVEDEGYTTTARRPENE